MTHQTDAPGQERTGTASESGTVHDKGLLYRSSMTAPIRSVCKTQDGRALPSCRLTMQPAGSKITFLQGGITMAKITLPSYIKDGSGRMEDAVLGQCRGISFMRHYKKQKYAGTPKQLQVNSAFQSVIADWKSITGIVRAAWEERSEGQHYNGYNAFIGSNSPRRIRGEHLELCPAMGEKPVLGFAAAAGTDAGSISCTFSPIPAGKHLSIFLRRDDVAFEDEAATLIRHDFGADPVSPVTIPSLEAGKSYTVYAVVTDAAYGEAKLVSRSIAAAVTTA